MLINRQINRHILPFLYHLHPFLCHLHPFLYHLHPFLYHLHPFLYHLHLRHSHLHVTRAVHLQLQAQYVRLHHLQSHLILSHSTPILHQSHTHHLSTTLCQTSRLFCRNSSLLYRVHRQKILYVTVLHRL